MIPPRIGLAALALAVATCCSPAPSQASADRGAVDRGWSALATQPRQTPAAGAALMRSWAGADGQTVALGVAAPRLANRPTLTLRPVAGDNGPAIQAALATLRAAGGGTLRLAPGSYPVADGPPAVAMDGLSDVLVDADGARLVFAQWGDGILISQAARLAIRGLSVGYARPATVAAQVRGGRLVFPGGAPDAGTTVHQITDLRPDGQRLLLGKDGRAPAAAPLNGFADGDPVQVKLAYYRGGAIRIADHGDRPVSHDITLDHVTVRDSAGGGVVVDLMDRGLAIVDSQFGTPGPSAIAYDALHVTAAGGDILVENNRFSGSGDDAINLASPILDAALNPGGRTAVIGGTGARVYPGARLALFDAALRLVGTAQVAGRLPRDPAGRMATTFTAPVAASGDVRYARNMDLLGRRYAVVGNQIADCLCHGVLVQNPDGLVRDNSFTGLRYNAIRVVTSAMWREGAGAQNVVVARNRIDTTGQDDRRGMMWAAITVYGELAADGAPQPPLATAPLHAGLLIRDNQIADVDQGCISVSSAVDVTLADNRCTGFNRRVDRQRMLIERASVADGLRRLPAKGAYLARGDGVWIDPLSTAHVRENAPAAR